MDEANGKSQGTNKMKGVSVSQIIGNIKVNSELKELAKDFLERQISSRGWQWRADGNGDGHVKLEGTSKKHKIFLSICEGKKFMALKDGASFFICKPNLIEQDAVLKALSLKVERVAKEKLGVI